MGIDGQSLNPSGTADRLEIQAVIKDYHQYGRSADQDEIKRLHGKEVTLHVAEDQDGYLVFGHDADTNTIYLLTDWRFKQ